MEIVNKDLKIRLKEAEDVLWSLINSYGYKYSDDFPYKLANEYFNKYGTDLIEESDE